MITETINGDHELLPRNGRRELFKEGMIDSLPCESGTAHNHLDRSLMDHFLRPLDAADSTPHSARLTDSKLLDDIRLGRAPHGGIEVNNLKLRKFSKAFEDSKRFGQFQNF